MLGTPGVLGVLGAPGTLASKGKSMLVLRNIVPVFRVPENL